MLNCKASMHIGKRYSIKHNLRDYDGWNKDNHINPERTPMNEVLKNQKLSNFFYEQFSDALSQYNEKNQKKHPDRVQSVEAYYNKNAKAAQEVIIQLGDHELYEKLVELKGRAVADEFYKTALKSTYELWLQNNISLVSFSATIHMDEVKNGTPHLHLAFVPIAEDKRGLAKKVSLDGAMKKLGFFRDKENKYGNTPYKQWLQSFRDKTENNFQQQIDVAFGKDFIKVLPSEHTSKQHQETWEYREKEKGLKVVASFLKGEGKEKIAQAEKIIDNAQKITNAITADANAKMSNADKRMGEAVRTEKVAIKKLIEADSREKETKTALEVFKKQQKIFEEEKNAAMASIEIKIEQEVQKRLTNLDYLIRQTEEDERYLNNHRYRWETDIEKSQKYGRTEQKELFEKIQNANNKKTKKGKGGIDLW